VPASVHAWAASDACETTERIAVLGDQQRLVDNDDPQLSAGSALQTSRHAVDLRR